MHRPGPFAPRAAGLLLAALALPGCFTHRYLGLVQAPVTPERQVPLTCVNKYRGWTPTFFEGQVNGRPAVAANFTLEGTLLESHPVGDATVFAAQTCTVMNNGNYCDSAVYVVAGLKRVYHGWGTIDPPGSPMPTSTAELVAAWRGIGGAELADRTALDAASLQGLTALGDQRYRNTAVMVGTAVAGAAAQGVGQAKHNAGLQRTGADLKDLSASIVIPPDDQAYAAKYPGLLPVLQALAVLGDMSAFCYGYAKPVSPSP